MSDRESEEISRFCGWLAALVVTFLIGVGIANSVVVEASAKFAQHIGAPR